MSLVRDVLLQLFFALGPFLIFNVYYRDKMRNYSRAFIIITGSLGLLLAMTFATSVVNGIIFDIRYVMIFFGLVYGGIQTGCILLIESVLYRLYIGGQGKWVSILIIALSFVCAIVCAIIYRRTNRKTIATFFAGISFSVIPLVFTYIYFTQHVTNHLAFHLIVIPVQNTLGTWLLMSMFSKSVADKDMFIKHAQHEKLEAMSHVAASLAHEVRNPLTAVKGFLKLMKEQPEERQKIKMYIEISLDEIGRTEAILSEYLSISKPPTERRDVVDLSEQLRMSMEVMTPYATMHSVELELHRTASPLHIMANPDEVKQVLVNFIKNAVEACMNIAGGKVILTLMREDRQAVLSIKDNGIGMAHEQLKRLGTIYFSTKSSGTGLGLTYSYQVIHALGGTVTVISKPQAGTKFTISVPLILL
jgi:two-component system sporulation sensor kinase B